MRDWIVLFVSLAALGCKRTGEPTAQATETRASAVASQVSPAPRPQPSASAGPRSEPERELSWPLGETSFGPAHAVVLVPPTAPGETWPVVMALHGRAESKNPPERGAQGWPRDYRLTRAIERLKEPPLGRDDFQGYVSDEHLEEINASLEQRPYRGLIVVCPYLPNRLKGEESFQEAPALARYLVDELLPRVRRETPAKRTPAATAIAGISLGARAALLASFQRPGAADYIGALQPAVDEGELDHWVRMATEATRENPRLRLRLLTSDADYYLDVTTQFHRALREAALGASLEIVKGDHGYRFNRGPGSMELLLYYDRVLRGEPYLR